MFSVRYLSGCKHLALAGCSSWNWSCHSYGRSTDLLPKGCGVGAFWHKVCQGVEAKRPIAAAVLPGVGSVVSTCSFAARKKTRQGFAIARTSVHPGLEFFPRRFARHFQFSVHGGRCCSTILDIFGGANRAVADPAGLWAVGVVKSWIRNSKSSPCFVHFLRGWRFLLRKVGQLQILRCRWGGVGRLCVPRDDAQFQVLGEGH
mmetsp:Transcript_78105/g.122979  ORF Transcript_78105/g.122979 Transcript_78105/m.122979 type:complete len:203 (+) Transcript_78105:103-711(+)